MMKSKSISNGKLSIGLPVFNGEKFLHKCLSSLLEQSYEDFEIIISDNASTDKTEIICQEYSKKDKLTKLDIELKVYFFE